MRILLIGSGGREHALGRKLKLDDPTLDLHAAPGNPGLAELGTCHDIGVNQISALVALAQSLAIDLVIVGPEEPLTLGLCDALDAAGIAAFGPRKDAAQLEASKAFAKDAMNASGVPTAKAALYQTAEEALSALQDWPSALVVKADGLAAGKGVVVCANHEEAKAAIKGLSGLNQPLLIEEFLEGPEISFFALVQGRTVTPLITAQDHKRVGEGDTGPNTGGMGAYSPGILPDDLSVERLSVLSAQPIADHMVDQGMPFSGVLFVGLMLTPDGPKVLEYNVRFGDPECQVLMARLTSPLLTLLQAVMAGQTATPTWSDEAALTVVLAAEGYPGGVEKGRPIDLPKADLSGAHLIHAGTKLENGQLTTNGGRVMCAVGQGADLQEAKTAAYELAEATTWQGRFFRRDIGWRAL